MQKCALLSCLGTDAPTMHHVCGFNLLHAASTSVALIYIRKGLQSVTTLNDLVNNLIDWRNQLQSMSTILS
jgi:hypothetical protein